jgi:hypothetical protein
VGLKNTSRGWDEPQLLNEAGTTPSHLLRPSLRLLRACLDVAGTNPILLCEPCLDTPTKIKLIKYMFPSRASSQILSEAINPTMPFRNFLRGFRATFRSGVYKTYKNLV